ncbi:hypothetical protein StoSoilB5_37920 [Arthrobacter sp. StoSoilB5]|nr:hypothetical protein StoSoilB5_37920 [Arthrobacter sp. StoSoilB5]
MLPCSIWLIEKLTWRTLPESFAYLDIGIFTFPKPASPNQIGAELCNVYSPYSRPDKPWNCGSPAKSRIGFHDLR